MQGIANGFHAHANGRHAQGSARSVHAQGLAIGFDAQGSANGFLAPPQRGKVRMGATTCTPSDLGGTAVNVRRCSATPLSWPFQQEYLGIEFPVDRNGGRPPQVRPVRQPSARPLRKPDRMISLVQLFAVFIVLASGATTIAAAASIVAAVRRTLHSAGDA